MPRLTHNGADLHYELDGAGESVLVISGFTSHSNGNLEVMLRNKLSETYQVLAVDNRGAGQTTLDNDATVTITDFADDIIAVMDALDIAKVQVLGHSMGGLIASKLALDYPTRIRSQVLVTPISHRPWARGSFLMDTQREMIDRGVSQDIINRLSASILLGDDIFDSERYLQAWVNMPADPFLQSSAGYTQQKNAIDAIGLAIFNRLPEITIPTLMMTSTDDYLVPYAHQKAMADRIPNAQEKIHSGGHVFYVLRGKFAPFIEDVLDFWARY